MNKRLNLVKESDIEKKLKREVEAIGGMRLKFVSPGRPGVPDNLVIMPLARVYFVECKRPVGGVLGPLQVNFYSELLMMNVSVYIVHDDKGLRDFITLIK